MKKKINETKPIALIYCRVSSDRQAKEGHGLDSQEHRCRQHLQNIGMQADRVFRDEISGKGEYLLRPGVVELFKYLDKHPYRKFVVIFDDLSRFARDVKEHFEFKSALKNRGIDLICPNFQFSDTPEGELIETLMAAQHQYHQRNNQRQVCQKMRARLELGYWTFNSEVPGYIRKNLPDGQWILAKAEPKASIIKEALEGFASHRFDTKTDVQAFLQRKDYLAENKQKRVYLSRVDRLLERAPMYAGLIEYPDWDVDRRPGKHEAIISLKTLQQVEDKLQNKKRVRIRQDYNEDFPLRPYVACAGCGKKLTASWTRGRGGNYHPYYRCTNNSKICKYGNKSIQKEKLEMDFCELLQTLKPNEGLANLTKAILNDLYDKKHTEFKDSTKTRDREVKRLETEIEKMTQRAVNTKNEIMAERYETEASKLISQLKALTTEQPERDQFDVSFGTACEEVMEILNNPRNKWDSGSLEEKGLVIKLVFNGDPVYDKIHGFGTTDLSCAIRLFERIGATNSQDVEMARIEPASE